ncbi:(deoxy)nucleoside triphosphate pyrophosphohydrolase [Aquisphaera insulae]|uniref:(deoxy)nucleoside triphosphate pyrophosphohydrolase n=1 Tax=Aquisphaera insulae TaxID=2712864 RepID=UPI00202ED0AC|nr:(deoxy)nucleoside triphosphate pyrophosphohydrolase [Aquisphaera insulae]
MSEGDARPAEPAGEPTGVGIGLIQRAGRYYVQRRPEGTVYAGYWEFPGGKCEPGETPEQAVARECLEETGLAVAVSRLRHVIEHRYPHGLVRLHVFDCEPVDPRAEPAQTHEFRWVHPRELETLRFPEANEPVLRELVASAREEARSSE